MSVTCAVTFALIVYALISVKLIVTIMYKEVNIVIKESKELNIEYFLLEKKRNGWKFVQDYFHIINLKHYSQGFQTFALLHKAIFHICTNNYYR